MAKERTWLERNLNIDATPEQLRCFKVLCSIASPWNLPVRCHADDEFHVHILSKTAVSADLFTSLSTFDSDGLTKLVIAAHEHQVRVSLRPETVDVRYYDDDEDLDDAAAGESKPVAAIRLQLNAREQEPNDLYLYHPGLDEMAETHFPKHSATSRNKEGHV